LVFFTFETVKGNFKSIFKTLHKNIFMLLWIKSCLFPIHA
jgi:hypothetical protein